MSKLLENKEAIRIAGEIIVVLGVVYHFHNKIKTLKNCISDQSQRIEEQEDRIKNLEKAMGDVLTKLLSVESQRRPPVRRPQKRSELFPPKNLPPIKEEYSEDSEEEPVPEEASVQQNVDSNQELDEELNQELTALSETDSDARDQSQTEPKNEKKTRTLLK